ncbi:MAG: hypothetical protein H6948_01165 [Zoogloeaceae bacterium]|nr:hypothetical protein [Zoogloeaceae bacterium]
MGGPALEAAMRGPVLRLSDAIFRVGADEIGRATGVDIGFMRPDLDALDVIGEGNLYWVGDSWNSHVQDKMTRALDDYFRVGMTREQLAQRLAEDFAGASPMGTGYWEMLADHTATKTREMGRVTGYERAGIQYVQVRAHLDERTTAICRSMHGRVIPVARISQQRDDYMSAIKTRDQEAAKASWVMHHDASHVAGIRTGDLPDGTGSPPYHFRCRTITVMYRGNPSALPDQVQRATYDRERLPRDQFDRALDRARTAGWRDEAAISAHLHHAKRAGLTRDQYLAAASRDLARAKPANTYAVVSRGRPQIATFQTDRQGRQWVTIVDMRDNHIITRHQRPDVGEWVGRKNNEAVVQQSRGGVIKWLIG